MNEVRKVRPIFVVFFVFALALLAVLGVDIWLIGQSEAAGDPQTRSGSSYIAEGLTEDKSALLTELHELDYEWATQSSSEIRARTEELAATEADRLSLAQQQAEQQKKFYQEMAELRRQQEELQAEFDSRAEAHIQAIGGVDATKGNEIQLDEGYLSNETTVPEVSSTPTPEATPDSVELETSYFGQFHAQFVCTCAECFIPSEWPDVQSGSSYILADPEFIPDGTMVTLDQGSSATFEVRDAAGTVTGREVIVFNANHSEANGHMQLYPKISRAE